MSVGPTHLAGALAGTPLAQTRQDSDRSAQQAADQARTSQSDARAEAAAGIGETTEEHEAEERDADGRRLWEQPPGGSAPDEQEQPEAARGRDPHGQCGTQLDVSG